MAPKLVFLFLCQDCSIYFPHVYIFIILPTLHTYTDSRDTRIELLQNNGAASRILPTLYKIRFERVQNALFTA